MKLHIQNQPQFTKSEHDTWKVLFCKQAHKRQQQIIPEFSTGLDLLEITQEKIPDLNQVNQKLFALTGWQGIYVKGFEGPETFYEMLAHKQFPIGSFIRDPIDLTYTPEPDIFHDLYGHLPFYTVPAYGQFCQDFGRRGMKHLNSEKILEEFQRLFWFSAEFGLVQTSEGLRIFGAGITSSFKECAYALSGKPQLLPFHIENIRNKEFRIDVLQETLFVLRDVSELYQCLDVFERPYLK